MLREDQPRKFSWGMTRKMRRIDPVQDSTLQGRQFSSCIQLYYATIRHKDRTMQDRINAIKRL
jgi:hypothetical protein